VRSKSGGCCVFAHLPAVWSADEFDHVASVRHAHDCNVGHMDLVATQTGRAGSCRSLRPGRVYLLSGACRGGVFYVDPCGVRTRAAAPRPQAQARNPFR